MDSENVAVTDVLAMDAEPMAVSSLSLPSSSLVSPSVS